MARYIDANKLLQQLPDDLPYKASVKRVLIQAPTADVVEIKRIEIIRDDLKWWLETNTEKGVVYIPKIVVEKMIAKMDGGKVNESN